jgi:acetyl CoA:N6-hydroxylysine acetyl transferase
MSKQQTKDPSLIPLFFKPGKTTHPDKILHEQFIAALKGRLTFRSLHLDTDITIVHQWVNKHYAKRFWQMEGDIHFLINTYQSILDNCHAHSFIGLLDEQIICLVDVYQVAVDELKNHLHPTDFDCGLHLLMAPPRQSIKDLSYHALREFLAYYFSFPLAGKMYAEPDAQNVFANKLAIKAGFVFRKSIQLSYKKANLYSITKTQFYAENKIS